MADDLGIETGTDADVATDDVGGRHFQRVKLDVGADGATDPVDGSGLPVNDAGASLSVDDGGGSLTVDGPLTDAQLRAAAVPVSDGGATVSVDDGGGSLTVDGPLTDGQLRAAAVPIDSEFAPPVALADNLANPTIPQAAAHGLLWDADGAQWVRARDAGADGLAATGIQAQVPYNYNGVTFDRQRSALGDGAAATGLQNVGNMAFNGATWDRLRTATADALAAAGLQACAGLVYNGATWDRARAYSVITSNAVKTAQPTRAVGLVHTRADDTTRHDMSLGGVVNNTSIFQFLGVTPIVANSGNTGRAAKGADGITDTEAAAGIPAGMQMLYNGATYSRRRGVEKRELLASAARVASTTSGAQVNYNARALVLALSITANPGGAEFLYVLLRHRIAGNQFAYVNDAAQRVTAANGLITMEVAPGLVAAGHGLFADATRIKQMVNAAPPDEFDVQVVHSAAGSWTYSLNAVLIP